MTDDSLLGIQLDEYRLETLLGQGGMARVYRGIDVRLQRYVAIKVIDAPLRSDSEYVKRFEREAQAIAKLEHPHIVRLYRYGEAQGVLYMAMQYIEGTDLEFVLDSYRADNEYIGPEEAEQITRQICSALDYAHSKGVIHRDIKPSNIMLDKQGQAYLADFGLALMTEIGTRGEIFGSPHYIAPEQAISSAGASPKSDLYSVGIILYEMFTGKWPFDAENPMDIAMMHMTDDPRPPRTLRPNIRPALEAVILKAIAKEPENRYANGVELANALEKALKARQQESWEETTAVRQSISERIILEINENPLPPLPAAIPQASATIYQPVVPLSQPLSSRTVAHPRPLNSVVLAAVAGCVLLGAVVLALFAMLLWPDNSEQKKKPGSNENTPIPNSIAGVGTEIVNETVNQATLALSSTPSSMPTWVVSPITNSIPTAAIVPTLISPPVQAPPQPTYPAMVASPSSLVQVATSYTLLLASHKGDSLFVMNAGNYSFPLALLHLGDGAGALDGSEWAVPVLAPGECVAVWKDDGKPKAPDIDCDLVGNEVKRQGSERFWQTDFNIYFNGVLVAQGSGKLFLFTIVG